MSRLALAMCHSYTWEERRLAKDSWHRRRKEEVLLVHRDSLADRGDVMEAPGEQGAGGVQVVPTQAGAREGQDCE